jgi:hypothetical protein
VDGRRLYTAEGKGAEWVQKALWGGRPRSCRTSTEAAYGCELMRIWVREWAKEGVAIERDRLQTPKHPGAFLPIRWIVERRTF